MELRRKERRNYKIENIRLPRARRTAKKDEQLYELEIIDEDVYTGRVKVHYVGYESEDDEWRDKDEIVYLQPTNRGDYNS